MLVCLSWGGPSRVTWPLAPWTPPWGPGLQLQLRPPGQAPDLSGHSALRLPSSCSIFFPFRAGPWGGGSARTPPRLCTAVEDQVTQIHVCDGAGFLFYEKGSWVITCAWKSAQNIVQVSEAPGQPGDSLALGQTESTPALASGAPPPAPIALALCCPPDGHPVPGRAPLLGTGSPSCLGPGHCPPRSGRPWGQNAGHTKGVRAPDGGLFFT